MNYLNSEPDAETSPAPASPLLRAAAALKVRAIASWRPFAQRVNGLPLKQRALFLVAALTLVVGLEWLAVRPVLAKAKLVAEAGAQAGQEASNEQARVLAERSSESERWQAELRELQKRLAALGAGSPGDEKLAMVLQRALSAQRVTVLELRGLGAEEVSLEKPDAEAPAAGASAAADGSAASVLPAGLSRTLYRHRFELAFGGDARELTRAIAALEPQLRPLRIERARLAKSENGELRATLTLVVLAKEKQWLVL